MQRSLLILSFSLLTACAQAAARPNVVWLVSEDNSAQHMKMYDPSGAATPRIAELARQGLLFQHAFSNAPVCSVARSTLITGCYASRIGTQFHRAHVKVPLPDGLRMFPAYLRDAGYHTSNHAKKDYNAIESSDVWDESSTQATWRHRQPGQPFFHQRNFEVTHESSLHFPPEDVSSKPTHTPLASIVLPPYHPDTELYRYSYARYHDCIEELDKQLGQVIDELTAEGLLEDTFVFYFADNGGVLPRSKGYAYDNGLHVPLVVRIPENWKHLVPWPRGTQVKGFVSFIDFAPTVLHLAAIPVPPQMDGQPFLGARITADAVDARDESYGTADRFDEKYDLVRSLRKGRYLYVRSYQPFNFDALQNNYRYQMPAWSSLRERFQAGQLDAVQARFFQARPPEELFDLATDPHAVRDLAGQPEFAAVLRDLRHQLAAHVKGQPDLSFFPESVFAAEAAADPVEFGQRHQQELAALLDIADLQLRTFTEARDALQSALSSSNSWHRYWALIDCSRFGDEAKPLQNAITALAEHDPERLVRVRAAECLGLLQVGDPGPTLHQTLAESSSPLEALLILNTATLLRDGWPGYAMNWVPADLPAAVRDDAEVQRRLQYLSRPMAEK